MIQFRFSSPQPDQNDNTIYTVYLNSPGYEMREQTIIHLKLGVEDLAGNAIATDQPGIYRSPYNTCSDDHDFCEPGSN